jgi:poly(hydroxyalkanoate) granule-associated protein
VCVTLECVDGMTNQSELETTMVKKLKSLAKSDDKQMADAVRSSAHQIWQAGLGAFAKAQEEGGKVFSKLVKEGTDLQKRTQKLTGGKVADTVGKVADNVGKQASGSWDKLEQVFEDRVSRALASLGVPSKKDIQALTKRVEELSKAVAELAGKKPVATKESKPAAAKKPVSKAASKAAPKVAAKAVTKPAAKSTPKKAVAKPAAKSKAEKPAAKAAAKPVAKKPATRKASTKAAVKTAPVVDAPATEAGAVSEN